MQTFFLKIAQSSKKCLAAKNDRTSCSPNGCVERSIESEKKLDFDRRIRSLDSKERLVGRPAFLVLLKWKKKLWKIIQKKKLQAL